MSTRLLHGDCRSLLKTLPSESVHCVVTSPPYFGLRDYGIAGQIGLEATPDAYVAEIVAVFREVRRVLRNDGTLWLNLGDSYNNIRSEMGGGQSVHAKELRDKPATKSRRRGWDGLKEKDLIGIPWMVAFALRADGWYLRQDIIWSKPNPMPESVRDRCTKAHEYLFLLSKKPQYFYDAEAIREPHTGPPPEHYGVRNIPKDRNCEDDKRVRFREVAVGAARAYNPAGRNKRSVWEVATQSFADAHFATFPPALIEPCILAGCPAKACAKCGKPWVREVSSADVTGRRDPGGVIGMADAGMYAGRAGSTTRQTLGFSPSCSCNAATVPGTVLDPFAGAGTTGLVADRLGRNAILIELNAGYADMSKRRIVDDAPLFAEVVAA